MKKVTITPKQQEIDWSKPQWVIGIEETEVVILTTGANGNINFEGTALPCALYPNGHFTFNFTKSAFHLLTEEIQFTISNQD
jgi:predicted Abi (CAAX) family protease